MTMPLQGQQLQQRFVARLVSKEAPGRQLRRVAVPGEGTPFCVLLPCAEEPRSERPTSHPDFPPTARASPDEPERSGKWLAQGIPDHPRGDAMASVLRFGLAIGTRVLRQSPSGAERGIPSNGLGQRVLSGGVGRCCHDAPKNAPTGTAIGREGRRPFVLRPMISVPRGLSWSKLGRFLHAPFFTPNGSKGGGRHYHRPRGGGLPPRGGL